MASHTEPTTAPERIATAEEIAASNASDGRSHLCAAHRHLDGSVLLVSGADCDFGPHFD